MRGGIDRGSSAIGRFAPDSGRVETRGAVGPLRMGVGLTVDRPVVRVATRIGRLSPAGFVASPAPVDGFLIAGFVGFAPLEATAPGAPASLTGLMSAVDCEPAGIRAGGTTGDRVSAAVVMSLDFVRTSGDAFVVRGVARDGVDDDSGVGVVITGAPVAPAVRSPCDGVWRFAGDSVGFTTRDPGEVEDAAGDVCRPAGVRFALVVVRDAAPAFATRTSRLVVAPGRGLCGFLLG